MRKYLQLLFLMVVTIGYAQVGINNTNPQTTLQIDAINPNKPDSSTGILVPRVSQNPTSGNEKGQLIFNTTDDQFYFWDGAKWQPIGQSVTVPQGKAYFTDTRSSTNITIDNNSVETVIPDTEINFTLTAEEKVQFNSTVNFLGRSSAFAPLFKLKVTNKDTNTSEIIDKASNTFLSDGISDYYGNLQLLALKKFPAGNYKVGIIAYYNNCCDFNFQYKVGGIDTPVSLLVQYK